MIFLLAFILIPLAAAVLIPFMKVRWKGIIALTAVFLNALLTGYFAANSLAGDAFTYEMPGSMVTGSIPLVLDALSGWFILVINLVFITGGAYGIFYMGAYKSQQNNLSLHGISFVLQHAAILSICVLQNSLAFLIAWEILAITSFLLIIFEHENAATIRAGINYMIQAHFSIIFLMIGFIWVAHKTNSYEFSAIATYSSTLSGGASMMLFLCFFIAFAIKAGFVPFHTWLPYAHPAAPSHVSGMMSGVIIKIGIYGILRMLLLIKTDYTSIGYIILAISIITGLYGVMLAIIQHNLKKLLAYHSIENIGIIGMGIGIGCVGLGTGNQVLLLLGFAGAMLHTLNHALFKSLLFYSAGNVYQAAHTMEIEQLGGLVRKMPQTTVLFLVAAIAICGIPPFNGFISEFVIYIGIYNWIGSATLVPLVAAILSMTGLVMIGGLAMLCFTKAFGVIFLGVERHKLPVGIKEVPMVQLLPLYLLTTVILLIGLFPKQFIGLLAEPVKLFEQTQPLAQIPFASGAFSTMQSISFAAMGMILLVAIMFILRKIIMKNHSIETGTTWGCGYVAPTAKQQYTAGSFVRAYSKLFGVFLLSGKEVEEVNGIFPHGGKYQTHPQDKVEKWLIDKPLKLNKSLMGRFLFLNNGKLQYYILYGVLFILSVMTFPLIYDSLLTFIQFLNKL